MPVVRFLQAGAPEPDQVDVDFLLTASELASAINADLATAARLLPVVDALVTAYAPGAPAALRREAQIRAAGWLAEQPNASRRSGEVGDISASYAPSMTGVLLHSAAKSLLFPYRAKTAGVSK